MNLLSAGNYDMELWFRTNIYVGEYLSKYYEIWSKPSLAKIVLTTELDVAYGYASQEGLVKGITFEKFFTPSYFMNKVRDSNISHIYYKTYEDGLWNMKTIFTYFYLAKVDKTDEIICLQQCEDENSEIFYTPCSFKHSQDEIEKMFAKILNFRFHLEI